MNRRAFLSRGAVVGAALGFAGQGASGDSGEGSDAQDGRPA